MTSEASGTGRWTTTDEALVRSFESATLLTSEFTHAVHVQLAWCYLQRDRFAIALDRFSAALRAYAVAKNVPKLYHETVTVAWMAIIHERLEASEMRSLPWEQFAAAHPELFARPSLLTQYYRTDILQSALAKRVFLLPR